METEAERLQALLDTCHRVLPGVENRHDREADVIRETCAAIEARLRELGVSVERPFAERTG